MVFKEEVKGVSNGLPGCLCGDFPQSSGTSAVKTEASPEDVFQAWRELELHRQGVEGRRAWGLVRRPWRYDGHCCASTILPGSRGGCLGVRVKSRQSVPGRSDPS